MRWLVVLTCLLVPRVSAADSPVLVALAPDDDARRVVALGPTGQVYEPDGKGAWIRKRRITTADGLQAAGRAGAAVVAVGDGVVYKLADNGWSALRLAQHGKAILSTGAHAVAAVGKQLFAIDRPANGEPQKLALMPADITALGGGARGVVIAATARGLIKVEAAGAKVTTLAWAPRTGIQRLVDDAWAITDRGALDLRTNKAIPMIIPSTAPAAVAGDGALAFVAPVRGGGLELVLVHAPGKIDREPITITPPPSAPVGVVVDRAKRSVVALRDGRLAVRDAAGTWTQVTVSEQLADEHPGPPPAASH